MWEPGWCMCGPELATVRVWHERQFLLAGSAVGSMQPTWWPVDVTTGASCVTGVKGLCWSLLPHVVWWLRHCCVGCVCCLRGCTLSGSGAVNIAARCVVCTAGSKAVTHAAPPTAPHRTTHDSTLLRPCLQTAAAPDSCVVPARLHMPAGWRGWAAPPAHAVCRKTRQQHFFVETGRQTWCRVCSEPSSTACPELRKHIPRVLVSDTLQACSMGKGASAARTG